MLQSFHVDIIEFQSVVFVTTDWHGVMRSAFDDVTYHFGCRCNPCFIFFSFPQHRAHRLHTCWGTAWNLVEEECDSAKCFKATTKLLVTKFKHSTLLHKSLKTTLKQEACLWMAQSLLGDGAGSNSVGQLAHMPDQCAQQLGELVGIRSEVSHYDTLCKHNLTQEYMDAIRPALLNEMIEFLAIGKIATTMLTMSPSMHLVFPVIDMLLKHCAKGWNCREVETKDFRFTFFVVGQVKLYAQKMKGVVLEKMLDADSDGGIRDPLPAIASFLTPGQRCLFEP